MDRSIPTRRPGPSQRQYQRNHARAENRKHRNNIHVRQHRRLPVHLLIDKCLRRMQIARSLAAKSPRRPVPAPENIPFIRFTWFRNASFCGCRARTITASCACCRRINMVATKAVPVDPPIFLRQVRQPRHVVILAPSAPLCN